jgi:hypothetical protein
MRVSPKRAPEPDPALLRRLYVDEKLTVGRIAARLGMSISTTRARMLSAGIVMRTLPEAIALVPDWGAGNRGRAREPFTDETRARMSRAKRAWANENARGFRITSAGYFEFTRGPNKGRAMHIVIMEGLLGRRLTADEQVHHIDENRQNNDPRNLAVMSRSAHAALHGRERALTRERLPDGRWR